MKYPGQTMLQRVMAWTIQHAPHLLLRLCTFPYYNALRRNTLDAVQAIDDVGETEQGKTEQEKTEQKRNLARRFILFKINESKYVQVAVS